MALIFENGAMLAYRKLASAKMAAWQAYQHGIEKASAAVASGEKYHPAHRGSIGGNIENGVKAWRHPEKCRK
jgi:hypothetical protein